MGGTRRGGDWDRHRRVNAVRGESVRADEGLRNVGLANDDLFATKLEPNSFDLVHARAVICPLGRAHEQMETYMRLARCGGTIVLEDPDWDSWHFKSARTRP